MKRRNDFQRLIVELKKNLDLHVLHNGYKSAKIGVKAEKNTLVGLFDFMGRNGFFSEEEQILRLCDSPELIAGQVISFYNDKSKFRIDVELK